MRKTKFLTGKQRVVFDFIRQRIYEGLPPVLREIAAHFGISGKATYDHLWLLRKKGYIHWEDGKRRTLSLPPPYKDDTRHSYVVKKDVPELDIWKGDDLLIDTAEPVADGDVILSTQGQIKRFRTGDTETFGRVMGVSRTLD